MSTPLGRYGTALRRAAGGRDGRLEVLDATGHAVDRVDAHAWPVDLRPGASPAGPPLVGP